MTEIAEVFALGDEVISLCPLRVTPEHSWEVGVEIPAGSTGEIVLVREPPTPYPYRVLFDIGLEVIVKEKEITAASLVVDDLALDFPDPVPREKPMRPEYEPTPSCPHRFCGLVHPINILAVLLIYGAALILHPVTTLVITFCVVVASLAQHVTRNGLTMPQLREFDRQIGDDEELIVDRRRAAWALASDVILGVCLYGIFFLHASRVALGVESGWVAFYPIAGVTIMMWLARQVTHMWSVDIVTDHDN